MSKQITLNIALTFEAESHAAAHEMVRQILSPAVQTFEGPGLKSFTAGVQDMNVLASNRWNDAIGIQAGAGNLSGVARSLVHCINQIQRGENGDTMDVRNDAAIRLIVHQMAFLCDVYAIDGGVYTQLTAECKEKSEATKAALAAAREKA
jgi:hypothetical protein